MHWGQKQSYGDGSKPWYLVNPKIAGKWMFIPLKMVLIGIDPYPYLNLNQFQTHPSQADPPFTADNMGTMFTMDCT